MVTTAPSITQTSTTRQNAPWDSLVVCFVEFFSCQMLQQGCVDTLLFGVPNSGSPSGFGFLSEPLRTSQLYCNIRSGTD